MIKARSLEAMLPAIIFTHNVYMSLLKEDHQEGAGVREPYKMYKMYKNATKCTRMLCKALLSNACCCSLKIRSPTCLMEA